jgi:hypothetical protein
MNSSSSLSLIKTFFYILLLVINYWIYSIVLKLQEQKDCLCNDGWRIENIKMVSILTMFVALINIFIPLNRILYKIPIVSTILTFSVVIVIFVQLFLLVRLSRQLNTAECKNTCDINPLFKKIHNLSIGTIFIISLIISTGILYL